jgi:Zn-dependent protease
MSHLDMALMLVPLFFAITMHEAAHAWAAFKCGDGTAWQEGRLSLNPLVHMELMGTAVVPLATVVVLGMPFGWAKPVPVTFAFVKRYQAVLIAAAGPLCNLLQAATWAVLGVAWDWWLWVSLCGWGVVVNLVLAGVNLLPVLPLDGGRIAHSLLPPRAAGWLVTLQPYGLWLVLGVALVIATLYS